MSALTPVTKRIIVTDSGSTRKAASTARSPIGTQLKRLTSTER